MSILVPTLVRIEYWSPILVDWTVGHAGINLLNPAVYVQKMAKREKVAGRDTIARAVDVATRQIFYADGGDLL